MVAYCASTRRIAFGGKNGTCVVHELRAAKAHVSDLWYSLFAVPIFKGTLLERESLIGTDCRIARNINAL